MTGRADYYDSGGWNAVCYECGRKRKASTLKRNWQGYYVCPEHWEPRQPQDFVRSVPDVITPPWAQPPSDTFHYVCTLEGRTDVAEVAVADCAVVEWIWVEYVGAIVPTPLTSKAIVNIAVVNNVYVNFVG